MHEGNGWCFSGKPGFEKDPLYGFKYLKQLYEKADPGYVGRYLVPTLWDKKQGNVIYLCDKWNLRARGFAEFYSQRPL